MRDIFIIAFVRDCLLHSNHHLQHLFCLLDILMPDEICYLNTFFSRDFKIFHIDYCFHFYLTETAALDLVAPMPGAECSTFFLVIANSPRNIPIDSGEITTGTNLLPL